MADRAFSHMQNSPSMERGWSSAITRFEHGGIWVGGRSTYAATAMESSSRFRAGSTLV
jgi:hypothetical protein